MKVVISCRFVSFRPMQKCLWVGFFGFGSFFSLEFCPHLLVEGLGAKVVQLSGRIFAQLHEAPFLVPPKTINKNPLLGISTKTYPGLLETAYHDSWEQEGLVSGWEVSALCSLVLWLSILSLGAGYQMTILVVRVPSLG